MDKMKKYLLLFLFLQSCSIIGDKNSISEKTIVFSESAGKIEVKLNKKGDLEYIVSSGTAAIIENSDFALEQAMNIATLRAKANLSEFINTDIKSKKTTETIIGAVEEEYNTQYSSTDVKENIISESNSILKGVFVFERKVSQDNKSVLVKVKYDTNVLKILPNLMIKSNFHN